MSYCAQLLLADSMTSYRELADKLGLSVNAVHKRIQTMVEIGVIRDFTTRLSMSGLQGLTFIMFGKSEPLSLEKMKRDLQASGKVYWSGCHSADFLIVELTSRLVGWNPYPVWQKPAIWLPLLFGSMSPYRCPIP